MQDCPLQFIYLSGIQTWSEQDVISAGPYTRAKWNMMRKIRRLPTIISEHRPNFYRDSAI